MSTAAHPVSWAAHSRRACWMILIASTLALSPIQRGIERRSGAYAAVADALYIPSGRLLRRLCLGHEGLVADIYWTRVVQYFGRKRLSQTARFELLGLLLYITTELDPHLIVAYRFGSIFLAEKPPAGAGQPQEALELLRRGIVANPDHWRLWQDLGFIYYWDLKDYAGAARVFEAGSERSGAMAWMKAMAANVAAKGQDFQTSRLLWSEIYRNGENAQIRRSAEEHLLALEAQEQLRNLNNLLAQYRERESHPARSFQELIAAGLLASVPRDPSGAPYIIGPQGRAGLSPQSRIDLMLLE